MCTIITTITNYLCHLFQLRSSFTQAVIPLASTSQVYRPPPRPEVTLFPRKEVTKVTILAKSLYGKGRNKWHYFGVVLTEDANYLVLDDEGIHHTICKKDITERTTIEPGPQKPKPAYFAYVSVSLHSPSPPI
ncbi:hypothetical protein FRC11_013070 [Ceratobasidium sp. 423]|nr:hypothetical protein FRC11_013070 [Ceratobasidium sp. 423]